MKMKKILALSLSVAMTMGLLAGCGSSSSETAADTSGAGETTQAAGDTSDTSDAAAGDVTTITYWGWDNNWYEPMFAKFMEENPDIKIEVTNVAYSDYFTKIQQAIASGSELPTMVQQSCTLIANYKELGIFEDLTKDPYNVDPNVFFDFIKNRAMTEDGQLIGIEQSVSPSAIAYKRD